MLSNFSCEQTSMMYSHCNEAFQVITIQTAADPGEGRGGGSALPGLPKIFSFRRASVQ